MDKIVSFIIPAYNVEKYIDHCLSSFVNTKILDQIEVIIVNDGSSDDTVKIATKYTTTYKDSYFIHNKLNGGHGSAINEGVKKAKGKFIKVIDADDWVITENLEMYVNELKRCQADVVLTNFHTYHMVNQTKKEYCTYFERYDQIYTMKQIMLDWRKAEWGFTLHGITYNRDFYLTHGIKLSEHIFYEDHEYATIPSCYARTIYPMDLYLYQYMIGNSEQSVVDEKQLERINHLEAVINRMLDVYQNISDLDSCQRLFYFKKFEVVVLRYYSVACLVNDEKRKGILTCKQVNKRIASISPQWRKKLNKKYFVYHLFALLHINIKSYYRLIHIKQYLTQRLK